MCIRDRVGGWTSFYDYRPDQALSVRNNFYTTNEDKLYKHYSTSVNRANFYGVDNRASVTFIFNPEPTRSKYFKTINYEGSNGWSAASVISDPTGQDQSIASTSIYIDNNDNGQTILSYLGGEYAYDSNGNVITRANYNLAPPNGFGTNNPAVPRYYAGFNRKENNYTSNLVNDSAAMRSEVVFGNQISGLKGYYLTVQMITDSVTNVGAEKQLFSVATNYLNNNGY